MGNKGLRTVMADSTRLSDGYNVRIREGSGELQNVR